MPIGNLTRLQRAHLPNIPVLKGLIAWFDAVSKFLDNFFGTQTSLLAAAYVSGNAVINDYGIASMTHPSPGLYNLFLDVPVTDTLINYILTATLANMAISDPVLWDIGIQFVGNNEIRIRTYSLADTAGVTTPTAADHDFYMKAEHLPV